MPAKGSPKRNRTVGVVPPLQPRPPPHAPTGNCGARSPGQVSPYLGLLACHSGLTPRYGGSQSGASWGLYRSAAKQGTIDSRQDHAGPGRQTRRRN